MNPPRNDSGDHQDDDATDPDQRLPRPGEVGWSSTGWPDSAGMARPPRVAPPTPPGWTETGGWPPPNPGTGSPQQTGRPQPAAQPPRPDTTTRWIAGEETPSFGTSNRDRTTRFDAPNREAGTGLGSGDAGTSIPTTEAKSGRMMDRLESLAHRLSGAARIDRLDASFSLRHLFANSFNRRSQEDIERELMVGTSATTPQLSDVRAEWPQPWLFARTFLGAGAVFALLFIGWMVFQPITLLPGLIIVGSFAIPAAVLIFFFEVNLPRNVSIVAVLRMVFLGGAASLLFSLIGFELFDFPWLGAMVAGLVEEPAKLLAVFLVARQVQHRYILNGMLFGAAIGAGFAAFESAGYALVAALLALDNSDVIDSLVLRGVLSPFGHIVWTAVTAGALWRVRDGEPLRLEHLKDQRFWRVMVLMIGLHTVWNSPIPDLLYVKFLLLGAVAWLVCFSLLQEGIGQIRTLQRASEPES